jgi:peptide/nickel transport system substrate-binding protein
MGEDDNKKKSWLPKVNFNKKKLAKQVRQARGVTIRHTHKFIIKRWSNFLEVQRNIIIWIVIMGVLIAATGLQLMWFRQGYQAETGANSGVYAEAVKGSIDILNPLFSKTSAEQSASYLMFSRLVNYDITGHLNYDLATGISVNDLNTVYTVKVRDNANWHDGQKLTADDIAFTVGLIKNSSTRSNVEGLSGVDVRLIDDYTLEFDLSSPYVAFEHLLNFPILPKHILGNVAPGDLRENNFSNNPVGSGPFKFSFVQEVDKKSNRKNIYMTRNESYYKGIAKIDRFQLQAYNTTDEIRRAILNGDVNGAADLYPSDITNIDDKKFNIESNPISSGVYAILNTKSANMQDITLRQALQLATNTDAIRSDLPITTPQLDLPVTNSQLSGDLPKAPKYNADAARKLLNDAGWTLNDKSIREKSGVQLELSVVTVKNNELERALEILSGQWRALGIVINTRVIDPSDVNQAFAQSILQPRNYDVLLYQLNIGADPDVYAYWHSSQATPQGFNLANYSNIISDDSLSSARVKFDPALRNAKYLTFANQWLADVPAIGLYQSTAQYVSNKNVKSVGDDNILISSIDRYSNILDWTVGSRTVYKTP